LRSKKSLKKNDLVEDAMFEKCDKVDQELEDKIEEIK